MAFEIKVPRLGWNMEQGTFLGWLKRNGEHIKAGDVLFALEGDKAAQDIEATDGGILHIAADGPRENDIVAVGAVLGFLAEPGEKLDMAPKEAISSNQHHEPPASPSVRRMARERGVDLAKVQGSGPTGRITEADVRSSSPARPASPAERSPPRRQPAITPRARQAAAKRGVDWVQVTGSGRNGRIRERDILAQSAQPLASRQTAASPSNVRRVIAERMLHSLRTTAPVTLTTTVDATNLVNLRQQFRLAPMAKDAIVPTYTDFIIKLTTLALQAHPALNARWEDDRIITFAEVHMGVAVDTEAGLLVPVIRHVERLSMRALAQESKDRLDRARTRRLTADEMQGGTFTVTNLGAFGIDAFTPIINWPQGAILGVGRIAREPAVVDGQVVPRDRVTLSLTFDHRLVDGAPAARFLQMLGQGIENPAPWLLG